MRTDRQGKTIERGYLYVSEKRAKVRRSGLMVHVIALRRYQRVYREVGWRGRRNNKQQVLHIFRHVRELEFHQTAERVVHRVNFESRPSPSAAGASIR